MEILHLILERLVEAAILLFEYIGVLIIIISGVKGLYRQLKGCPYTRLNLARGMSMGLEFKLGSEILRTVVVRDYNEILLVGGIILLRASLTFLIHWEIKNEELNMGSHNK